MSRSEMFSPEDIAIIQSRQLRKTIHYLYTRSPFYRDRFDRNGVVPAEVKTLDDLERIPPTTAEDLRREGDRFLCVRPEEVADVVTTSGTTGAPYLFKLTEVDLARLAYNEQLSFRTVELGATDVVALAVTLDHCYIAGLAYALGLRRVGAAVLRVGPVSPPALLDLLVQARVTALVAEPAYLLRVVRHAEAIGFPLAETAVRRLVCIGEAVRTPSLDLDPVGKTLAAAWNAQVFSSYGTTELSGSLCECPSGAGGHLHPELMHIEVVDDQGRPLPAGETGELCVTPFGVTGMPVLRFRTGDLGRLLTGPCACGRHTLRLGPVAGRKTQLLRLAGREVLPHDAHVLLQSDPGVLSHLIVAESGSGGEDRLSVRLEAGAPEVLERVRGRFQRELGLAPELHLLGHEELEAMRTEDEYRKSRWFLDRRADPSR
jgi:phenylacetate-CoA ligase